MMAFLGLTPADYAAENTVLVWPDNWRAVMFFHALGGGSWNLGPGGATGLRPEAFREVRLAMRVGRDEWPDLHSAVLILQDAALDEMHKD